MKFSFIASAFVLSTSMAAASKTKMENDRSLRTDLEGEATSPKSSSNGWLDYFYKPHCPTDAFNGKWEGVSFNPNSRNDASLQTLFITCGDCNKCNVVVVSSNNEGCRDSIGQIYRFNTDDDREDKGDGPSTGRVEIDEGEPPEPDAGEVTVDDTTGFNFGFDVPYDASSGRLVPTDNRFTAEENSRCLNGGVANLGISGAPPNFSFKLANNGNLEFILEIPVSETMVSESVLVTYVKTSV